MMDMVYKQYVQYQWICLKDKNKLESEMKDIFFHNFNTLLNNEFPRIWKARS